MVLYPVAVTWMLNRDRSLVANAASLLLCGILAGVVVAASAFPVIAMSGLAAKAGVDQFGDLPDVLQEPTPPQITYVYASDNKTRLAMFYDENRHDIPLGDVPMVMRNAIIAAEDQRFYEHNGVDLQGILRAYVHNQGGDSDQGASTLTMQYVRNAITYSATSPADIIAATEHTSARKLREARLALALETKLTKNQILERYLNIAAFGHGAYGIYAASEVYFGKEPKDLTLGESALLASLPQAPSDYDMTTADGLVKAKDRRVYVLTQMVKMGTITQAQADAAAAEQTKVTGQRTPNGCVATTPNAWGFFCDYFYRWWISNPAFGPDEESRAYKLKSGGYHIVTTMDVTVQNSAKANLEKYVTTGNPNALMLAAIEPGTGRVRALATNRIYGLDTSKNKISSDPNKAKLGILGTYPETTNPLLTGGNDISGYKSGSTFKMFTMLAALEKGYPADFTINAKSPYHSSYIVGVGDLSACKDKTGQWCPVNSNPGWMDGPRDMWTGYGRSVNTYFIPLEEKIGAQNAVAMAKRLGIQFRSSKDKEITDSVDESTAFGPFTIGVTDTVPLELANAYATVAAEGKYCTPIPLAQLFDAKGNEIKGVADPQCKQVVSPDIARVAEDVARCPIMDTGGLGRCNGGTGTYINGQTIAQTVGYPVMGKTGTSDDDWTANLALSTKQLTIAGVLANPDYAETPQGGDAADKVNAAVAFTMRDAMKGKPKLQFATPTNKALLFGIRVAVPNVTCKSVLDAQKAMAAAGFFSALDPTPVASTCPNGTVARTDPSGSTSKGTEITLYTSKGPDATATPPPGGGVPIGGTGGGGGGGGPGRR
jgi:membrane peptidoglycan carboxypeptidase